nr:hypothetical protein [Sedimentibacter sp.]
MNKMTNVLCTKNLRKTMSMMVIVMMLLSMNVVPAFGTPGVLSMLTLPSSDFTKIVEVGDPSFNLTVTGLDDSYGPAPVDGSKVVWSTSDPTVATVSPASGSATTTVTIVGGDGIAVITASYTDAGVASVTSNVVVESATVTPSVNNISVLAIDSTTSTPLFASVNMTVNLTNFTSSDVVGGDMSNVLKSSPSVMTALVASAKANGFSPSLTPSSTGYTISSGGSYLSSLAGLSADYVNQLGWTYTVLRGGVLLPPEFAASIIALEPGDFVVFYYDNY